MFKGGGGRFPRTPPSRWSGPGRGNGGRYDPYRGPPEHRIGSGAGFRPGPGEFDRGFHGHGRDPYGGNFAKLYIGAVPRTATEGEIRPLFEEFGKVIEVAFIKDRRTCQQQPCCFVKYATVDDAERAIGALDNQYTLPGGSYPIQVRYADGEKERLSNCNQGYSLQFCHDPIQVRYADGEERPSNCNQGAFEYKLFVKSLHKQATEREIEEIFTPFGQVEDIYLMKDEMNQNRCCFIKLANREMAEAAINALHGTYVMRGCDQPLIVRFADPKKPRHGELRGCHTFGGPAFHLPFQGTQLHRHTPNWTEPGDGDMPSSTSQPISPQSVGPSPQVHQLERLQMPLSDDATICGRGHQSRDGQLPGTGSLIQKNTSVDSTHRALRLQEQVASDAANGQQSLISQRLLLSSNRQSPSSCRKSQWNGRPQSAVSIPGSAPPPSITAMASIATVPVAMHLGFHIHCAWSEHTCPDGFKYYYNCITRESIWEKPKEYADYEQRRHKMQQEKKRPSSTSQSHLDLQFQSTQASPLQHVRPQMQSVQ